jgi:hypothetical protein
MFGHVNLRPSALLSKSLQALSETDADIAGHTSIIPVGCSPINRLSTTGDIFTTVEGTVVRFTINIVEVPDRQVGSGRNHLECRSSQIRFLRTPIGSRMIMLAAIFMLILLPRTVWAKDFSVEIIETTKKTHYTPSGYSDVDYSARLILPDGTHALIACDGNDRQCLIQPWTPPEKTPYEHCAFVTGEDVCTRHNLGSYKASRKGDDPIIYHRKGKVRYRIVGPA